MINLKNKLFKDEVYSLYLFAFLIPLNPKWYGYFLLIFVLESIFKYRKANVLVIKELITLSNPFIWLVLFYFFHLIGLQNTSNFKFASMDLGMKSTLIVLPLYFTLLRPKFDLSKLLYFFLYGCVFSLLIYTIVAFVKYYENGVFLMGSQFSFWMHRGYYSSYLLLGFTFVFTEILRKSKVTIIDFSLLLLLFVGVIVTESKIGILIVIMNTLFLGFHFMKSKIGWVKSIVIFSILCFISVLSVTKILSTNNRFSGAIYNLKNKNIDITSVESTTARILMWETSLDLIRENFIFGVGTGDVKDELQKLNYEKAYTGVAASNLNAHNQFFNSWVAIGVFGMASLLGVFLTLFRTKKHKYAMFIRYLSVSLFLIFLTESFLEVQAGIIPFAFLISLIGLSIKINTKQPH